MKSVLRRLALVLMILFLAGSASLRAHALEPDPKFDASFTEAVKLVSAGELDKAFEAYVHVKNDNAGKNPELAGDALLRAALLGYNTLTLPPTEDLSKLSNEAQQSRSEHDVALARNSHDALKQMTDDKDIANSPAAVYALKETHWPSVQTHNEVTLKQALEDAIDQRNSHLFSYQLVDKLVKLTGGNSNFSYWFALILIAIVVKTITFPLTLRTYKSQRAMQKHQPQLKALQEKYKGKPELNEKMMEFYRENNVNPFASCFPMLIQLPFMYFVYNTIRLYEYHFSHGKFLWIGSGLSHQFPTYVATDLAKFDIPLLVIYAASNYLTMLLNPSPDPAQAAQQKSMSLMMTITFFFIFMKYQWSAAFIFYWLVLNFISAFQQYNYIYKPNRANVGVQNANVLPPTESDSRAKENGGGALTTARPVTPIPGGNATRPRPKPRTGKRR